MDDDVELVRLALWALLSTAATLSGANAPAALEAADTLLAAAEERFPFLKPAPPPDPTGGLIA